MKIPVYEILLHLCMPLRASNIKHLATRALSYDFSRLLEIPNDRKFHPRVVVSHLDQWESFLLNDLSSCAETSIPSSGSRNSPSPPSNKSETIQCSKGMASLSASKFMNQRLSGLLAAGVPIWSTVNVSFRRANLALLTWKMLLRSHSIRYSWISPEIYTSDKSYYLEDRSRTI